VRYGVSPNRIWPFPYEPDYDQITNRSTADVAAIRQRFQISADRRYLLYCGRLSPEKRVDLLLDSFAELAADHSNWDIVIAGDGPLRAELQKQVPANLTRRVYWLGFLDDQAAISALYRVASVFVLPSDYEPWAVVINEAAAAGLAIVASDMVGAAADLVRDGVNGRIFANGNRNSLTECLRDLLAGDHATEFGGKSLETLAEWRRSSDPIEGLRKALQSAGVGALTPV
jgi:glycosyltransferase involved in cell wall biosynthesis